MRYSSLPLGGCCSFWLLFAGCLIWLAHLEPLLQAEEFKRYEYLQIRLGVPVNVVLYASTEEIANQASQAAYDRFREIDRSMSDYDPDSELMRLCQQATPGEEFAVSKDLFEVLQASQALSRQTGGAFDITVGPVVKLWRVARRRKQLPDPMRLETALAAVGYEAVQLKAEQRSVTLHRAHMQLDLGAIAKGYAADQALLAMQPFGVTRVLIDAGGDLLAGDPPPDRDFWRIEVEKLRNKEDVNSPAPIVYLKNAAIATSGDVYQHLEIDGTRYSHIVDPKTGVGLTTPSTVSVIATTGMIADSLASAVSVLGPQRGLKMIQSLPRTECLVVTHDQEGVLYETKSAGFGRYLCKDSPAQDTQE